MKYNSTNILDFHCIVPFIVWGMNTFFTNIYKLLTLDKDYQCIKSDTSV